MFNVLNLKKWLDEHQDVLRPPVRNKEIYPMGEFIVMAVGGPNSRTDYHYNETPEFFYQVKGNIVLKIVDNGVFKDIHINEGDIYLLPSRVPHSPQRPEGSVGLVIEQKREAQHQDGFIWYCENCQAVLHETYLQVSDIVTQLPIVLNHYKNTPELHLCKNCGHTSHK